MSPKVIVYSFSPICHRCNITDPLVEKVCKDRQIAFTKNGLFRSLIYIIGHGLRPPVIVVDGVVKASGRILTEAEIHSLI